MARDVSQRAKASLDLFLGDREADPEPSAKDPMAVELGRRGGLKGGKARAVKLSPGGRSEIARKVLRDLWPPDLDQTCDRFGQYGPRNEGRSS